MGLDFALDHLRRRHRNLVRGDIRGDLLTLSVEIHRRIQIFSRARFVLADVGGIHVGCPFALLETLTWVKVKLMSVHEALLASKGSVALIFVLHRLIRLAHDGWRVIEAVCLSVTHTVALLRILNHPLVVI